MKNKTSYTTHYARTNIILLTVFIAIVGTIGFIYVQFQPSQAKKQETDNFTSSSLSHLTASHDELVQHALKQINDERTKHGLGNVTLSPIKSGQKHAETLLRLDCSSHWDDKGMKPYMRYARGFGVQITIICHTPFGTKGKGTNSLCTRE